ncbi:inositol polyphosphate 5-phosphatase [Dissophora globulifera]|uniref:phosphoinositide 5-phosphatase n=1 Tax=Dissophora globulifera TaxID=979702 RepID=A0A9P6RUV3_9FUNG|nr:inositol polyphosphate 5-phosphatase [Dissophora globulifera]
MQSELYLSSHGESARTLALKPCAGTRFDSTADHGHVLYFSPHDDPTPNGLPQVAVRLEPASDFHAGFYRKIHSRPVYGCLGLMYHAKDTFLALVTGCAKVGDVRLGESVYKIIAVKFFSLTGNTPDEDMIPAPFDPETAYENEGPGLMPHPCRDLEKVLCNGAFFFSPQFDLTRAIKIQDINRAESNLNYDERFLWNMFMLKELLTFRSHLDEQERGELDAGGLLVHIIQGYVGSQPFRTAATQGQISVISRLGSKRAGTRYNTRGIDDNGHVANFVEGLQLASHKIQLSRGPEATKPAVRRHFEEIVQTYEDVHILDLLGTKDQGEVTLSQEYRSQVEDLGPLLKHIHMTRFDYHSQVKGGNYDQVHGLLNHVRGDSERYGYFYHDLYSNTMVQTQRGVFRTNCLDCLDRTNVIQSNLSKEAIEYFYHNVLPQDSRFGSLMVMHSELWADNGDLLSKIYTGTGALKSEVTRSGKMSFASMLGDATKSLNRFVINNFQDKDRQEVIDLLLGKMAHQSPVSVYDPVHDSIASEMKARSGEYSQAMQIDVFVGTYNLNGKLPSGESLDAWLRFDKDVPEPDMYMIGFQEIVKLTARQIAVTDENKRLVWENEIEKTINRRGGSRYVQLRSVQLVGAALMVYVKEQSVPHIRNVEYSIKKTGLKGMAGNKGAVAIRMDYYETSLCLVTAHLASGQENLQERNEDFHTINNGIAFARGRNIASHNIILWCGDFNYRVDMENDQIRALVSQGNYFEIFRCDQLKRSIDYGEAFYGYQEGIIAFAPTYRYDIGTDHYDTSEKYRAPAWTDRILYRGRGIYQTSYERAEYRTSDHRPVMSMFVLELTALDSEAKDKMEEALYRKSSSKSLANGTLKTKKDTGLGAKALLGTCEPQRSELANDYHRALHSSGPRPSSDGHQWWNEPLGEGIRRIPSANKNPFEGDQTITQAEGAKAMSSRPAPPAPVAKKPVVDLLGDIDSDELNVPVLSMTPPSSKSTAAVMAGGTIGNVVKLAPSPSSSLAKKNAPPPPVSRRAGPPTATLPASSVIHMEGSSRRPAPPPPKTLGAVGAPNTGSDDDDDDDDVDDDDDDDDDEDDNNNKNVGGQNGRNGVLEKKNNQDKPSLIDFQDTAEADGQETLLKPSQLKQQQQQQQQRPLGVTGSSVAAKKNETEWIRPSLSTSASVSSPNTSATSVPSATIAANKSKVLLPGFDPRGRDNQPVGSAPSVASMGLGFAGNSAGSLTSHQNTADTDTGSVLQRTREFNSKAGSSSTPAKLATPLTMALGSGSAASGPGSRAAPVSAAKHTESKDEDDAPGPSVSQLKKSFAVPSSTNKSVEVSATAPATTSAAVSGAASRGGLGGLKDSVGGGAAVAAVIPMVKPLSFSVGHVASSPSSKSKAAVQGSGQPKMATETEDADIMPKSGSVKQAIAALKGGDKGEASTADEAGTKAGAEGEESVDAFAFWQRK